LPPDYNYKIKSYSELEPIITAENVNIGQIAVNLYVDINDKESALNWLNNFQETLYPSNKVKQKNKNREVKNPNSLQNRDTNCTAILDFKLEKSNLKTSHPLEINLRFTHNYLPNSAALFSFHLVSKETQEQYIDLFSIGHTAASARYVYEDKLHLSASDDNELAH
ncbi:4015_t:CDS:2, partial [Scutellospora calospora]